MLYNNKKYKNMIKTFEQFINENYNEMTTYSLCEEYGAPLFNEVSESLMYNINRSINEGRLVLNANMIEEGIFDTFGKLFKKGSDSMLGKLMGTKREAGKVMGDVSVKLSDGSAIGDDLITGGQDWNKLMKVEAPVYEKIMTLCDNGLNFCENLAEKEAKFYENVQDAMDAANEAIQEFTKNAVDKIKEIIEIAEDKISAAIAAIVAFCQKMAKFAKDALQKVGQSISVAVATAASLACLLGYSVYKGALTLCDFIAQKVKDAAEVIKEAFVKVKNAVANWVSGTIDKVKNLFEKACETVKDAAEKTYKAIGNAFLSAVAILGQVASDAKEKISEAYSKFVDSVKNFTEEVKTFIKDKWDKVTTWCKNTASTFAEGVKTVWGKIKDKVMGAVGAVKDAYQTLKDNAKATWEDIKKWTDDKQKAYYKDSLKYAADKWGKDEVSSWMDEL